MSDQSQGEGWWMASDGKWYPPDQRASVAAPPHPTAAPERPTATGAFICGIIGSVIGLIPLLGILAIPLGLIGFFLGLSGWRRKPERAKLARAATILGALAVVLGIVGIVIVSDAFDDLDDELDRIDREFQEDLDNLDAEQDALVDGAPMEVTGCDGSETITGTITNGNDIAVNAYATIALLDGDGVQVGDTLASVQALAAGRTAQWDATTFGEAYATCEITLVEVYPTE